MKVKVHGYYSAKFDELVGRYSSLCFEDVHSNLINYLPPRPARILDVGAGIGRDALRLSALGYFVVACEPNSDLRAYGVNNTVGQSVEWVDDQLPELAKIKVNRDRFDVVLASAVWMHLNKRERRRSLDVLWEILEDDGFVYITYRTKALDKDDIYYSISYREFVSDIEQSKMKIDNSFKSEDKEGRKGVRWFAFVLRKR